MGKTVRVYLNPEVMETGKYRGVPSDGTRRDYLEDGSQDLLFCGAPFRCGIPDADVCLVTLRTYFYGTTAFAPPAYILTLGVGNFHHGETIVSIMSNAEENGRNLSIESPSVAKLNATLAALRSGDIKREGRGRTMLEEARDTAAAQGQELARIKATRWWRFKEFVSKPFKKDEFPPEYMWDGGI